MLRRRFPLLNPKPTDILRGYDVVTNLDRFGYATRQVRTLGNTEQAIPRPRRTNGSSTRPTKKGFSQATEDSLIRKREIAFSPGKLRDPLLKPIIPCNPSQARTISARTSDGFFSCDYDAYAKVKPTQVVYNEKQTNKAMRLGKPVKHSLREEALDDMQ
jgi:hypothetical protein